MHRRKLGSPTYPRRFGRIFLMCDEQNFESRQGQKKCETYREGCGCRRQVFFGDEMERLLQLKRRAGMRRLGWDDEGLGAAELFRGTLCMQVLGSEWWVVVEDGGCGWSDLLWRRRRWWFWWWMVVTIVGRSRICNAGKSGRVKCKGNQICRSRRVQNIRDA